MLKRSTSKNLINFGRRKREIQAIVMLAGILFVSVCLLSYNPHDSSWFFYTNDTPAVSNVCGAVGANIAGLLVYLLGGSAMLLVGLLLFVVYMVVQSFSLQQEWDRLGAFGLLVAVVATMSNVYHIDILKNAVPGGFVGYHMHSILYYFFDKIGSIIFLYALLMISLILLLRFSFVTIVHYGLVGAQFVVSREKFLLPAYRVLARVGYVSTRPFVWLAVFLQKLFDGSVVEESEQSIIDFERGIQQAEPLITGRTPTPAHANVRPSRAVRTTLDGDVQQSLQASGRAPVERNVSASTPQAMGATSDEGSYQLPDLDIFIGVEDEQHDERIMQELEQRAKTLEEKLERFGVYGSVVSIKRGPVVTLFEYQPQIDSKISKIIALEDDLALALKALSIRIIAPIPGKSVVGFEVANSLRKHVYLAQVVQDPAFAQGKHMLPLVLGQDTIGANIIVDLAKMPHLLIAGSTGSGKSVALNAMLVSLLCRLTPDELKIILIDPKRLEFASYADVAHLLFPIVTDPRKAAPVLKWVVLEMEQRYEQMAEYGARSLSDYNKMVGQRSDAEPLPFIVVIIDELSDLMMTASKEIEDLIARITQMARAAGIHLIVATQRPSVDVITGLIKVNFPSRISFRVTSKIDSRTILDCGGAEKLLGRGDMLFLDSSASVLRRVHGAYVSDQEIEELVHHIRSERKVQYLELDEQEMTGKGELHEADEKLYKEVIDFLGEIDEVSISLLQRRFRIGYNRSARIISMLESQGVIMPADGGKTRKVIR